jgi:kinesin family protein C1
MCAQNPQTKQGKVFTLDCCLDGEQSQKDVWRRIEGSDLVEKALDGLNVTLMAYGQTGSGKTYTMFGESSNTGTDLNENSGLVPRMITELLESLFRKKDFEPGFDSWKMEMSVVEIYNETVRDLMPPEGASVLMSSVFCEDSWTRIDRRGQSFISKVDLKKKEDAMAAIETSYTRRVVEKTAMNEVSSRSHCIISLLVQQMFSYGNTQDDKFQLKARVNLVDLAGSERGRTRKWNANDDREAEAIYINKSLLVLNQVIFKLSEGQRHAPFRESKAPLSASNQLLTP